jgi:hypothetical protein
MIETICADSKTLAIIIRASFKEDGIHFFTPNDFSQQLAYMKRPAGYVIQPHIHNSVPREVLFTKEVLVIKSGRVRVDFYTDDKKYLESTILVTGDVILLAFGGHGFYILDEAEIIEVKQGPYAGDQDKSRFDPIEPGQINMRPDL